MNPPKSRLINDPATGEPRWGVGAGTVETFLKAYYPEAQHLIRIASAYFTVEGYNLGRSYVPKTSTAKFKILVGKNEGDRPQLVILNEVESELKNRRGIYAPMVRELVRRIEANEFIILSAREMQVRYHCKFYICDDRVLVEGSGNYTGYGLRSQHEQASATRDSEVISDFTAWFEEAAQDAKDLTQPLLRVLQDWLMLARPFDAYLKFLAALDLFFDRDNVPGLLLPVYYQKWAITRAVDHIQTYRAAILIAATGLGKTIIGAELAFQLKRMEVCDNLIVMAPLGVHADWKNHLKPRGFYEDPFSIGLLFRSESEHTYHKVYEFDTRLDEATNRTLIIIDEAHALRNQDLADWRKNEKQYRTEQERAEVRGSLALDRLRPLLNGTDASIVLLTATPYGTNPKNLESLLRFLPTGLIPKKDTTSTPLTLDDVANLPFVTSLGLKQVLTLAQDRNDVTDGRMFVQFDQQKRYMPAKVHLCRVDYRLTECHRLCAAFNNELFAQVRPNVTDGYSEAGNTYAPRAVDVAQRQFIISWISSPLAIADCLHSNLYTLSHRDKEAKKPATPLFPTYQRYTPEQIAALPPEDDQKKYGYQTTMRVDWQKRVETLKPLYEIFSQLREDDKARQLLNLLTKHAANNKEKVIVFVERHATALFLTSFLLREAPGMSVGCMVQQQGETGYALKDPGPRKEILDGFSPLSRGVKEKDIKQRSDVLICTDANGIGINLQDANVVVNYDPADSADILFQRAGRIIRFTNNAHRHIFIYTFKPIIEYTPSSTAWEKIEHVFDQLGRHHDRSKGTFGLSILPDKVEEVIDLTDLKKGADFADSLNLAKDSTLDDPLIQHTSTFEKHRELACSLKDGVYSAMVYKESQPRIAVLLELDKQKRLLLYNLATMRFEHEDKPISILRWIACDEKKEKAPIDIETIERATKKAINKWLKQQQTTMEPLLICGFYLSPKPKKTFARTLLRPFVQLRKRRKADTQLNKQQ